MIFNNTEYVALVVFMFITVDIMAIYVSDWYQKKIKEIDCENVYKMKIDIIDIKSIWKYIFIYSARKKKTITKHIYVVNFIFYIVQVICIGILVAYCITKIKIIGDIAGILGMLFSSIICIIALQVLPSRIIGVHILYNARYGKELGTELYEEYMANKRKARIEKNRIKKELRKERRGRKTVWNKMRRILIITLLVLISLIIAFMIAIIIYSAVR